MQVRGGRKGEEARQWRGRKGRRRNFAGHQDPPTLHTASLHCRLGAHSTLRHHVQGEQSIFGTYLVPFIPPPTLPVFTPSTQQTSTAAKALTQHFDTVYQGPRLLNPSTHPSRFPSPCAQQTSTAAKALTQHFDAMFKGSSGIQGVSKTLQSDFLSAVTQLFDVYKTQLQAAGDVLSAGTNAALSQVGAATHH